MKRGNYAHNLKHAALTVDEVIKALDECLVVYGETPPETIDVYRSSIDEWRDLLVEAKRGVTNVRVNIDGKVLVDLDTAVKA